MPKWISIGRSATSDIVLEADTVSRIQGCFTEGPNGSWSFLDAASTNGVWHNGERIRPRRVVYLADGDELLLGPEVPAVFKTPHGLFEALAVLARHEDNGRGPATESGTPPDRNHLSS